MTEVPRVRTILRDRMYERAVILDDDANNRPGVWKRSDPIPGTEVLFSIETYHNIHLVVSTTESGHYRIYRTTNSKSFSMVHDHATEIFGVFYLDEGVSIFSATDGWFISWDAGSNWAVLDAAGPVARSVCSLMGSTDPDFDYTTWSAVVLAIGDDKKIYRILIPDGSWEEVYDTATLWTGPRFPSIGGVPDGVLVGVGPYLFRSTNFCDDLVLLHTLDGDIKSITASSTHSPIFLIEAVDCDWNSSIYWTYDLGDSLLKDETRHSAVVSIGAVIPTGESQEQQFFLIDGSRSVDSPRQLKFVERRSS